MESDETKRVLDRARQREKEIDKENNDPPNSGHLISGKGLENENMTVSQDAEHGGSAHKGMSPFAKEQHEGFKKEAFKEVCNENLNIDAGASSRPVHRNSRFAMLSARVEEFEYEMKPSRPKESYLKGPSPRLSIGETRPSALFAPNFNYYPPAGASSSPKRSTSKLEGVVEKDIALTNPGGEENVAAPKTSQCSPDKAFGKFRKNATADGKQSRYASTIHESSSLDGCADDELDVTGPLESTALQCSPSSCVVSRTDSEHFGIQTFFKRKTGVACSEEQASSQLINQPSPILKSSSESPAPTLSHDPGESPVRCTVPSKMVGTRGDIVDELTADVEMATKGLNETPSIIYGRAKALAHRLEEKVKQESGQPSQNVKPPFSAKTSGSPKLNSKKASDSPVNIHWRVNIPGGSAGKAANSHIDTTSASVKKLRNRWEVSSATGTPLHPDQDEKELLEAARAMAQSVKQFRSWKSRPVSYVDSHELNGAESTNDSPRSPRPLSVDASTLGLTYTKLPSIEIRNTEGVEEEIQRDEPKKLEEKADVRISEVSGGTPENNSSEHERPDQLIDDVFHFINETPNRNSSFVSALLNTPEAKSSMNADIPKTPEEASADDGMPLAHSVSFYRKRKKLARSDGDAIVLGQFTTTPPQGTVSEAESSISGISEGEYFAKEKARLEEAISVQQEQIAQASRALSFCRSTHEFRGSREEVDAQRALLIATERRRALIFVLDRLLQAHSSGMRITEPEGPRGTLTISHISLKLMRDFINGHINYHDDHMLFYFIILIRHEETVLHTTMTTSDEGLKSGRLEFPHYIQLKSLLHNFSCSVEVYSLRTRREVIGHYEKYRIKSATVKKSSKSAMFSPGFTSPGGPSAVIDPSFQRVGHLTLNIGSIMKGTFQLRDAMSPLDGTVQMKLRCYAEEAGTVGHKGFMSLYQEVEGIASWTRFWCVLGDGLLRFWRYPEDENKKPPVVTIDLRTCACDEITPLSMETCPFPNSMKVDVWLPSERHGKNEKIRIMMAADKKGEMHEWLSALNISLRNLTLWNPGRLRSID